MRVLFIFNVVVLTATALDSDSVVDDDDFQHAYIDEVKGPHFFRKLCYFISVNGINQSINLCYNNSAKAHYKHDAAKYP